MFCGFGLDAQQAWTQKKGEGYFHLGGSLLNYASLHDYNFSVTQIPRPITEFIVSSYMEYGLSDKLTAALTIPYHMVSSGDTAADWTGFSPEKGDLAALGNANVGLTYKLYQKSGLVVSSKLGLALKSAKLQQSTGLRTGYDAFGISPFILAGIGKSKYYASVETGMNFLSNGYLQRFVLNAQLGRYLSKSKRTLFVLGLSTSTALGRPSPADVLRIDGNARYTGLYVNEQSYYAVNLKLGYNLSKNWTIWSSVAGGMAKNIGRDALYSLSLGYKLKKKTMANNIK